MLSQRVVRRQRRAHVRPDGHQSASRRAQFFSLFSFAEVPNEPRERTLTVVDDVGKGDYNRELLAILSQADPLDG